MVDNEKAEKFVELSKKKPDYNPYDEGDEDEYGMVGGKIIIHTVSLMIKYI